MEEDDLFPGGIGLFDGLLLALEHAHCKQLNERKQDPGFVDRVKKRFEENSVVETLLFLFTCLKEHGLENDKDQYVLKENNLKHLSNLSEDAFKKTINYGMKKSCLKKYIKKGKPRIVLVSEDITVDQEHEEDEDIESLQEAKKVLIALVKKSKHETEEGYLFLTEESCLEQMELSPKKLSKLVKLGLQEELFKFDEIKNIKIVVYTDERRLAIKHL